MPHNFTGLDLKHENFRKGFFIDPYDEPTYLTFAIDFKFEDTPSNKNDMTSEALLSNSPLFSLRGPLSASKFLESRGFPNQAHSISQFNKILQFLTFQAPWYFQSISGLGDLYSLATNQEAGYKTKDIKLEVATLEAVDLRIFELASLYRNAIFDTKFRRERVPDNLRWFSMDIYIAEFRNLRFRLPGLANDIAKAAGVDTVAIGNIVGGGNAISTVMDQFGYIKFTCRQCEFDFSNSLPTGKSSINIGGSNIKPESGRFSIKVGWVDEEVKFADGTKLIDDWRKSKYRNPWGVRNIGANVQNVATFLSGMPVIGEKVQDAGQKAAASLATIGGFVNPALQAASEFIDPSVKQIGDAHDIGYASNGDTPPKYNQAPSGDAYNVGYASNGDTPPKYGTPPNGQAYPKKVKAAKGPNNGQIS